MAQPQLLKLKGNAAVFIDYANVYGWRKHLSVPANPKKLYSYLKKYSEVKSINFYYGTDTNPQAKKFLSDIKKMGYSLTTKPVKYITIFHGQGGVSDVRIRKCDFDIEICMDVYKHLSQKYDTFIFMTGDGDFAPIYRFLINQHKQVIVIYEQGHLGKEIWDIKQGVFKTRYSFLQIESKIIPPIARRA